ncbi:MAG: hypothetical protein JRH05_14940 [Deltaproteobacteria bacterium]|nr:hypothetical protein [Deltaproteobacteria bacterium]
MLTHRAAWAMMEPRHWIASPAVTLEGNRIVSVAGGSRARTQGPVVDHGPGVILPILVNAHTHLSLSALRGRLPWDRGFVPWVQALMKERAALSEAQALGACGKAVEEMTRRGVGAVGEFGPHVAVEKALGPSPLAARVWLEFFGDARRLPPLPGDTQGISWAYAAHAPHTVSPGGLCRIREQDRRSGRPWPNPGKRSFSWNREGGPGRNFWPPWAWTFQHGVFRWAHQWPTPTGCGSWIRTPWRST